MQRVTVTPSLYFCPIRYVAFLIFGFLELMREISGGTKVENVKVKLWTPLVFWVSGKLKGMNQKGN